ncbi:MAG: class I tRNA ligase family protein [Candidatus Makana argininalis]
MKEIYIPKNIETKIQKYWIKNKTFKSYVNFNKKKYYCVSMIPYPSGSLHMGHVRNYTIGDVISRYNRMIGKNVLQPIGWDAFGLPAENAAIKNNISPYDWTYSNILLMKKQLKSLGLAYDWDREINTSSPDYYKWEQLFFINLYKKKLIYKKKIEINWCPKDKTVLANEQVINNRCWRCDYLVERKEMSQWFIKITKYADRLLKDIKKLNEWPENVKNMQKKWIGKSKLMEIKLIIHNSKNKIKIYTHHSNRFMEIKYIFISFNNFISKFVASYNIFFFSFIKYYYLNYITNEKKFYFKKKFIKTGLNVINPFNGKKIPIISTNFKLVDYEYGSTIGFNKVYFNIKKKIIISSKFINNLNSISNLLILYKLGKFKTKYKLQDWCISRQRYWGVPIPIIKLKNGKTVTVPKNQLPVLLSQKNYKNKKLNKIHNNFEYKKCYYKGSPAVRESDTFDTFMESSWYYVRYTCNKYNKNMVHTKSANYWLPIDQYIGGIEHANMHLLYFRFYHKLLKDFGFIKTDEPVKNLLCQGMVLSDSFYYLTPNGNKKWISPLNVQTKINKKGKIEKYLDKKGRCLIYDGLSKMSKSKNNGINPNDIIKKYGADTLRLFIMFSAPVDISLEWKNFKLEGINKFLKKLWYITYNHVKNGIIKIIDLSNLNNKQKKIKNEINKIIYKITDHFSRKKSFNIIISYIMQIINKKIKFFKNDYKDRMLLQEILKNVIIMLYPFTPHICFALWKYIGGKGDIDNALWPIIDKNSIIDKNILLIIQINGKVRSKLKIPRGSKIDIINNLVFNNYRIKNLIKKKKIIKKIYIPDKLINLVTN